MFLDPDVAAAQDERGGRPDEQRAAVEREHRRPAADAPHPLAGQCTAEHRAASPEQGEAGEEDAGLEEIRAVQVQFGRAVQEENEHDDQHGDQAEDGGRRCRVETQHRFPEVGFLQHEGGQGEGEDGLDERPDRALHSGNGLGGAGGEDARGYAAHPVQAFQALGHLGRKEAGGSAPRVLRCGPRHRAGNVGVVLRQASACEFRRPARWVVST